MPQDAQSFGDLDLSHFDFLKILAEIDEGVIITDGDGRVVFYNYTQSHMDRLDPNQVLGRLVTEIYGLNETNSMIVRCLRSGQPIINQVFYYRPGRGRTRNAIHSVYPLKKDDRIQGAICFMKNSETIEKTVIASAALSGDDQRDFDNGTRFAFSDLIGADAAFLDCLKRARTAAMTKSSIMICGETGTGKEMLAQAIHNHSPRRTKPFVAINCAAIPENLQESILFGTTRGAFTGAMDKPGLFEEAQGGTLYLDEIDSMPPSLQVKLLRVLQERKLRRVGSPTEVLVDVRIVSSINKEWNAPIADTPLRKDLYYRLSVVFIEIPPLRERIYDIEALSRHFIHKNNFAVGTNVEYVSTAVMTLFTSYDWPGNVRELEHVIEGALNVVSDEVIIEIQHLPRNFAVAREPKPPRAAGEERYAVLSAENPAQTVVEQESPAGAQNSPSAQDESLSKAQARREKELIDHAMLETQGNISKAARILGLSRQLLHYKLKKFSIDRKKYTAGE